MNGAIARTSVFLRLHSTCDCRNLHSAASIDQPPYDCVVADMPLV
jgi:hypothetical protein